jgi:hypothetical protein
MGKFDRYKSKNFHLKGTIGILMIVGIFLLYIIKRIFNKKIKVNTELSTTSAEIKEELKSIETNAEKNVNSRYDPPPKKILQSDGKLNKQQKKFLKELKQYKSQFK